LPGKHIVVYYFVFQDTSLRNSPSAKLMNNHFSKFMSQTQRWRCERRVASCRRVN